MGSELQEASIESDKLSYEIFSILESKFLFGYGDEKVWVDQKQTTVPSESESVKQRGKVCILSIDGGGMRGVLSGKALAYLEQALKAKSGNPDARIADFFDLGAGTGIGGIFTAMLFATNDHTTPIFQAKDTWTLLANSSSKKEKKEKKKKKLFRRILHKGGCGRGRSSTSSSSTLSTSSSFGFGIVEMALKDLSLKDTVKPVLIPCYDLWSRAAFVFSRADALQTESFDFRLWEVCRATWGEPSEPVQMRSVDGRTRCVGVDGGLAMSNPTAAAITHVLHNTHDFPWVTGVQDLLVLSLGLGTAHNAHLPTISADANADLVDLSVAMAFAHAHSTTQYLRIQATGSSLGRCGPNVDTDSSPGNVNMLIGIAEEMLKQKNVESVLFGGKRIADQSNFEKLDWFAGELVQEHQRRSCRIAPTVAFNQEPLRPA